MKQATQLPKVHYDLRLPREDDFEDFKSFLYSFHAESPYSAMALDTSKAEKAFWEVVHGQDNFIIIFLTADDAICGMLIGTTVESLVSFERVAAELAWWVDPAHRTRHTDKLRQAFEYWATERKKVKIIQMAALENDYTDRLGKFYEKKGYRAVERSYIKEVE